MNVFQLLLTVIVAGVLLFFIAQNVIPLLNPEANLKGHAETLLLEAQSDLGQGKGLQLGLKSGQSLRARNLDAPTRNVAFACAGNGCCEGLEACGKPLSVTQDRILVHENTKATMTARCESISGIHACTLFVGDEPAQLVLSDVTVPSTLTLQGQGTLSVSGTLRNSGEVSANAMVFNVQLIEDQILAGTPTPTLVQEQSETIESLAAGKSQSISLDMPLNRVGTFTVRVRASSLDAGFEEKQYDLHVNGTEAETCATGATLETTFDSFENACRTKLSCSGCAFAYECRNAWKEQAPAASGSTYDDTQGTPDYTFLLTPSNGTC